MGDVSQLSSYDSLCRPAAGSAFTKASPMSRKATDGVAMGFDVDAVSRSVIIRQAGLAGEAARPGGKDLEPYDETL